MSSQPQLQRYFSHLNMSGLQNQAELRLIADDASIPTEAQMRRALRSSRRGSATENESLDRRSFHTPSCLKDSGKKGLMRWDASPSSSSLALSMLSRNKTNKFRTPSTDCLLVLPQRRWNDQPSSSRSDTRSTRSEGFKDSSNFTCMQNGQHNSLFEEESTRNWQASCAESSPSLPSLNKSSSNRCQQDGYLASILSSLAQGERPSSMDGNNHTTGNNHSQTPTVIIARALDISMSTSRSRNTTTDVTTVTRTRRSVEC